MKHARRLRSQLDDWQQMWRQVDAFVDRLETARDEDDVARRKTDALLSAAGAVERARRAAGVTPVPLGDPMVDVVPRSGWDETTQSVVGFSATEAWDAEHRPGRLPGNDDVELAVANLATAPDLPFLDGGSGALVLDAVHLVPARETLEVEVDGVLDVVRVPSYPGAGVGGIVEPLVVEKRASLAPAAPKFPPVTVDLKVASLFSAQDRRDATTADPGEGNLTTADPDEGAAPFVRTWSSLVVARRMALPGLDPRPPYSATGGSSAGPPATGTTTAVPLTSTLLDQGAACAADARDGRASRLLPGVHRAVAQNLASAATAAAATASPDAALLRAAADLVEEEGVDSEVEGLQEALRSAADAVGATPEALTALAAAAGTLAAALLANPPGLLPSGGAAAALAAPARALETALAALPRAGSLAGALALPVELGPIRTELDVVLADRLAYPDGSLRLLRALEVAFARWWPAVLRWMAVRAHPGRSLDRAMRRFLQPFVDSLAALVGGTGTGLATGALRLGAPASVGGALLVAEAPASLAPALSRVVEAGQLAVLAGDRPAGALVLGVDKQNDRLTLPVAPVRVSLVPPDLAPGSPGLVPAGADVADRAQPLSAAELRRGFADDPARDGLVEQAVALHSQLALLLGRTELAARLAVHSGLGAAVVPEPPGPALGSVTWHGQVPSMTSSFVLHGAPEAWWDRSGDSPAPLLARPGELLLLRGQVPPDPDGSSPGLAQTVVEVDRAVWLPGSMIDRVDTSRAAVLARDPAVLGTIGGPALLCAPKDDLVLLTLRRTWQAGPLQGPVTLRRDFPGFDLATLAVGVPLGDRLVRDVTGSPARGPAGVDRELELGAARGLVEDWTRHAR